MQRLDVALGERSYPIFIGAGLLDDAQTWSPWIRGRRLMLVSNDRVAPLYLSRLRASLEGREAAEVILSDGECYKNLDGLNRIFDALLQENLGRDVTLVALGGGVVGDMAGFAAACYQRGVDFVQVPTTLLAQVDSSVGGKTGVNHALGKNMIGAFHQPRVVVIDTRTLASLPPRELAAGLAEVIKYGLILDSDFLAWLESNLEALQQGDAELTAAAIRRCCEIKAQVVAADEREGGQRALLNLGHTFGHAIEAHQGYGNWLHGEAVAAGTCLAASLSAALGWLSAADVARIERLLERADLPLRVPVGMSVDDFLQHMARDKKVVDGRLRLVLLRRLGEACVTSDFAMKTLRQVLEEAVRLAR